MLVSPLFSAPWVKTDIFKIDWLHCADQGATADFLGNVFELLLGKMPGENAKQKCRSLWLEMQSFYDRNHVQDKLQNLIPTMICQSGKVPKLRCSAAQCRALVPFAYEMTQRFCEAADPVDLACKSGTSALHQCYMALSSNSIFWKDTLATQSKLFAAQYVAIEAHVDIYRKWKIKPKLHMFLELCSSGSKPSCFWTYRDEDFGGTCARLARRRGGLLRPSCTSATMLDKFKIKTPVARII